MVANQPQLEFLLNLTPLLTSQQACGAANGGSLPPLPKLSALKKQVNP